MKGISRREFIKAASAAAINSYIGLKTPLSSAGMMGGGGGMGRSGTSVIDPPPGAAFQDPVTMPATVTYEAGRRVVAVDLIAKEEIININGVNARLLTYNGHFPGPTIVARKGDILRINLNNSLPMLGTNILGHDVSITNLHTHGLHVSPKEPADYVMLMLMPGEGYNYEYDLSTHEPGTLNFYHSHVHGSVAEQLWGGMAGGLVIEDETDVLSGYETHTLVLKDITLSGNEPEPYNSLMDFMHGKDGNIVMVNGQVNPVLPISPGQVQRWRILNGSNARFYKLTLENHTLYVVGTDGGLLDKPYPMSSILLSPGERVDILIKASQTQKDYRLLSLPYNRGGGSMGQQVTLMIVRCNGLSVRDSIPSSINPYAKRLNVQVAKTERLVLSMGQGRGYINGISFEMLDDGTMKAAEIHSVLGTYEVWEIINQSGMDHPFHQHTNPCQVLSINGGDSSYRAFYTKAPAWKDVVLIPKWGSARILVPVMDYEGMSMFHCHIPEHEDIGMMGIWHIMGMM